MKINYEVVKIKWFDFIPVLGFITMLNRVLELGDVRFYPVNVLKSHLIMYFNGFISVILLLLLYERLYS